MRRLLQGAAGTAGAQAALAFVTALQALLLLHSSHNAASPLVFGQFSLALLWLGTALSFSSALFGAPLLIRQSPRASALFWRAQLYFAGGCALITALLLWVWQAPLAAQLGFALAHFLALLRSLLKQLQQQRGQYARVVLQDLLYATLVSAGTLGLFLSDSLTLARLGGLNALLLALLLLSDLAQVRQLQRLAAQRWYRPLWWRAWQQQGKAACGGVLAVELLANSYLYLLGGWYGAAAVAPVAAAALLFRPVGVLLQGMLQRWRPQLRQAELGGGTHAQALRTMQTLSFCAVMCNTVLAVLLLWLWPELVWPAGADASFLWLCLLMAVLTALRAARQLPVLLLQAKDKFGPLATAQWPVAGGTAVLLVLMFVADLISALQSYRLLLLLIVAEAGLYLRLQRLCAKVAATTSWKNATAGEANRSRQQAVPLKTAHTLAVLLCCHNRKTRTLASLQALFAQTVPAPYQLQVFLVDDASSDGSANAVRNQFPQVQVIAGNGQLYWNGAMRLAWQQALAQLPDPPAFIWLNDDVVLDQDALSRLISAWQQAAAPGAALRALAGATTGVQVGAIVGAMREPGSAQLSYGGRRRLSWWRPLQLGPVLAASAQLQRCDFINGNCCLIPATVVAQIGILDPHFTHSMGDYDYGLRAQQAGFSLWQAPGSVGECAANTGRGGVLDAALPMAQRLQLLQQPNRWPPAAEWQYFVRCHGGPLRIFGQLRVVLRKYCPRLFLWLRQRHFPQPPQRKL